MRTWTGWRSTAAAAAATSRPETSWTRPSSSLVSSILRFVVQPAGCVLSLSFFKWGATFEHAPRRTPHFPLAPSHAVVLIVACVQQKSQPQVCLFLVSEAASKKTRSLNPFKKVKRFFSNRKRRDAARGAYRTRSSENVLTGGGADGSVSCDGGATWCQRGVRRVKCGWSGGEVLTWVGRGA